MKTEKRKENRPLYVLILVFVALAAGIITAGYFYYENYARQYRSEIERQLSAVADLKEHELVQWRKERLGDANVFYKNIVFSGLAKRSFGNQSDADAKKRIKAFMGQVQAAYSYSRICLHDAAGVERISIPEGTIHPPLVFSLRSAEVLKSGKVELQDFYRDENDKKVYLTIFVPVFDEYDTSRVLGVLAMRIDPEQSLYTIISRWLTPSRTAEILISRREGNDILFLNELKYQKNTALSLRVSMENKELPSVKAELGQRGIVEGVDYRGVPVLADVRKIPDSPWFLVARIDLSEVNAPLSERLWTIVVIIGLLLVSAGAGAGFLQRQQRMRFYLEQHKADEALRDSEERYRTTMMSVGDGVITTDTEGRLKLLNPVAEALTGWRQEEARSKPLEEVFRIIHEETRQIVENPVRRVMREGIVVGLANHSVLIGKDGTEHPIADSGAPIRNEKGEITGVVLVFRDQTQERMAQKALRESEEKYRNLVENASIGIFRTKIDGSRVLDANPKLCEILGLTREEFVGQPSAIAWAHPGQREDLVRLLREKGTVNNYEIDLCTKSGDIRTVIMSMITYPELGYLEGGLQDITERKRMEEELLKLNAQLEQRVLERTQELRVVNEELNASNEELNATNEGLQVAQEELQKHREEQQIILDSVPAWIFYKDRENRFIRVNQAFADVMGMAKEQLEGKGMAELYPKDQADAFWKDDKKVIESGQPKRNIIESMDSPGGTLWVQTDKLPYRDIQGNIIGIIGFTVDITERKKLEDSLRDQAVKTEALNKELESFAYSVSHDLRAPLRHISGYVELLTSRFRSVLSEKGQHYLDSIADSVRQMGLLIDNLLQFSRTGRAEMRRTELEMNGIVQEAVESVLKDNPDRTIEWVVGKLPSIYGDDAMLRLVWMNLLSNAVKFTRTRKKALIEIGGTVESKEAIFFVRDNGVGFDMQYAQKLFGVFQRLHSTEEFEGTGIGLANVHRIVLRHGGRAWAEAELNKGATFCFSIPKQ